MKHAFLIMAHSNFEQLKLLLKKLDHKDNMFYIHIDAKAEFNDTDAKNIKNACVYSPIEFIKRSKAVWGGYSLIAIELKLLEAASAHNCDYYHLLSGVDFPIKPLEYIHNFFIKHNGTEFIDFCPEEFIEAQHHRLALYSFFRDKYGRNFKSIYHHLEEASFNIQRVLKIDRTKKYKNLKIQMGSQWFSITDGFVKHIIKNKTLVKKIFKYTTCCDECFVQTLALNSDFFNNTYYCKIEVSPDKSAHLRSIDWSRKGSEIGAPYNYTIDDYDQLVNSENLFARKIDLQMPKGKELLEKLQKL